MKADIKKVFSSLLNVGDIVLVANGKETKVKQIKPGVPHTKITYHNGVVGFYTPDALITKITRI